MRERLLDKIEQEIERLDPDAVVQLDDLIGGIKPDGQAREITEATIMLLQKYGIKFEEGD